MPTKVLTLLFFLTVAGLSPLQGQSLLNVDFGAGESSGKTGFAATGRATNDFWNLYSHYRPRFVPGMPAVPNGAAQRLKFSDGGESSAWVAVTNAPGVWGNTTGDPMYDSYIFAPDGSNITVTVTGLAPGHYHFYLYGHADADATGEMNSVFRLKSGGTNYGPLTASAGTWKAGQPWREGQQVSVFRDVNVDAAHALVIEVSPGPNGLAVLNGLQIVSRGSGAPRPVTTSQPGGAPAYSNVVFREIHYSGTVGESEARFAVTLNVESLTTNEISAPLFAGDVAVIPVSLPPDLRIVRAEGQYRLVLSAPGNYHPQFEVAAKITRAEPWNQISFTGPAAAIASVTAQAGSGVELQLLSGASADAEKTGLAATGGVSRVQGFLGEDRLVSMRWQSKTTEVARKLLVTVDTTAMAQIAPTVIRFTTVLRYELLQASVQKLAISIPAGQALTRLQGEQVRDWNVKRDGTNQVLTVEFVKPVEKNYTLTLFSEQTVEATPFDAVLSPPQPLEVERESGSFNISTDDVRVEIESAPGLRQVNAPAGALAAYRFSSRPFGLNVRLRKIEPMVTVADRVGVRLEETRLLVSHALTLTVEKAGIYAAEFTPQAGFVVAGVRGEGVEDWKVADGKLRVAFAARVLGVRRIDVQLEQSEKTFPTNITLQPLRLAGATRETAMIGAGGAAGLELKSGDLTGVREIPITQLPAASDELLAFTAEQGDWSLTLLTERLPARIVAEVFNLITVGDGVVGGSATLRYGIINQGVQEFRVRVPQHWKNVEFTGPNIRRKEQRTNEWVLSLQDKAWGGYTLVVTYDFQFDPQTPSINAGGLHAAGVERETGSVAVTSADSLKLTPQPVQAPLRIIDQTELAENDRALITRPVVLACRYTGSDYALQLDVSRHPEERVLDAVADRTQLTSVITEAGEMLTQASFMVKNNDRQFQGFTLPADATLWGCYVNNEPVKAERDGKLLLVSLPRGANRDEAFAVDLVYAQKVDPLKAWVRSQQLSLVAPQTDVPNTYAEWQVFVPTTQRVNDFGGNMTVARGTTYSLRDAWGRFVEFYRDFWHEHGFPLFIGLMVFVFVIAVIVQIQRQGFGGVMWVGVFFAIAAILAGMLLPSLSKAKSRAQRISSVSNLKQVGMAVQLFANEHDGRMPTGMDEMAAELGDRKVAIDPISNEPYVYTGAGKPGGNPQAILAYSPTDINGRNVLFADGSVSMLSSVQFAEALQHDAAVTLTVAKPALTPASPVPGGVGGGGAAPARVESDALMRRSLGRPEVAKAVSPAGAVDRPADSLGGLAVGDAINAVTSSPALPAVAGLRSIRIEIPKSGQSFTFTKVLNISGEPLSVKLAVIKASAHSVAKSVVQLVCFLAGLLLVWSQWRSRDRKNLWLAAGLALVLGSTTNLLLAGRVLHYMLIAALPFVLLLILALGVRSYGGRIFRREKFSPPTIPPATALLAFLLVPWMAVSVRAQATQGATITSAIYTGVVGEKSAQFDATLQVMSTGTNAQMVALFEGDAAIAEFAVKAGEARLVREGGRVSLLLTNRGAVTVQLKVLVKLGGDATRRRLEFALPPALSSRLSATIDEPEADVEFPSAVSFKRSTARQQTMVEAIIGASDRVDLQWTPRMKRVQDMEATVFSQAATVVTLGGGVVNTRAVLDFTVAQGELRQARVRLPEGQRLLRVEGEWIRTWEIVSEGGVETLSVDLVKGVTPAWRLTVETERVLGPLPSSVRIAVPHAVDVKRETGLVAVRATEELAISVEAGGELQRVDNAEFVRVAKEKAVDINSAYRYLRNDFSLVIKSEAVQPQIEAVVRNHLRLAAEQMQLSALLEYSIKRAGVFSVRLGVPAGWKVASVTLEARGDKPAAPVPWTEKESNEIEVALPERVSGAFSLRVEASQTLKELPRTLVVDGIHALGTEKLTGFISVASEAGMAVKTESFEGLTEIPASSIPARPGFELSGNGAAGVLAFKFISTGAGGTPWKLTLGTEQVDSWVRAEVANVITVSETLLSGRAVLRYEIANAPVKEFRLRVPAGYTNVEIRGVNIRRRDLTGDVWRVELQNKVRGRQELTVTWEQPRVRTNAGPVELPGVHTVGTERETGTVAILARAPLQVLESSASAELAKIDPRELPDWSGVSSTAEVSSGPARDAVVLAYRYARPGFRLAVTQKRFDEAELLQALVENLLLTSVVAEDGQIMTEMTLAVRNNGRQFLEVELPAGAKVWSAFVAGQPVRPSRQGNKLLLPMEKSGADDGATSIELIYVGTEKFPRRRGSLGLISPALDVPFKNARWDLYLPKDYEFRNFSGTMVHDVEEVPMLEIFSAAAYGMVEARNRAARLVGSSSSIRSVKEQLKRGNLREAGEALNQARGNQSALGDQQDLKELEQQVKRAQGSNLINAQRNYSEFNTERYGGGRGGKVAVNGLGNQVPVQTFAYDAEVAEQQASKLQQQQEIAVTRVQPLRVNLPKNGQKLSFSQVLQTETRKPMTIRLDANNPKMSGWLGSAGWYLAGFLVLWVVAALLPARRERERA